MSSEIKLFAKILKSIGLKYVVGIVGSGASIKLVNALIDKDIIFIHTHHEGSASIIAGAINRSSKSKAISISIKGPGLINMLIGISFNNFERINSISVSEEYTDPIDRNKLHKRINQTNLLSQFTKSIYSYKYILINKEEFIEEINSSHSRPIHISLSNSIYKKVNKFGRKCELAADLKLMKEKLKNSQKPVLIIGKNMLKDFQIFIEKLEVPFFLSVSGLGIVSYANEYYAGAYTGEGGRKSVESKIISQADLLIFFGLSGNEVTGKIKNNIQIISFDLVGEYIEKPFIANTKYLNKEQINSFLEGIKISWGKFEIKNAKQIEKETILLNEWSPAFCFDFINRKIKHFNLVLDTGSFAVIAEHIIEFDNRLNRKYFGSSNSRFMGTSLPTAIGVSLANEEFPTICIIGDGGISPYISELKIISEFKLPLILILISNGGYGSIDCSAPEDSCKEALYFKNSSWDTIVKGFGINTFKCDSHNSFINTLNNWDMKSAIYIECIFEKNKYKLITKDIR